MTDPRAENCRRFELDHYGQVIGVALTHEARPETPYRLARAELVDEATAQGNTVATCRVLDAQGIQLAAPVRLAWPYPQLTYSALPGNQANQHVITNAYTPPSIGPLALYVSDSDGAPISDIIGGLGLPLGHHVSYALTWVARAEAVEPEQPSEPAACDHCPALLRIAEALEKMARHFGA